MIIDDAINFVVDEVEDPALLHPNLEDEFKNKVTRSKTIVHRIKKVGDLKRYLQRFEVVPPPGDQKRALYDRFKELGLKTYEDLYPEFVQKFAQYIDDVTVIDDFVLGKEYSSWDISIFSQTYDTQSGIYLIGDEPNYQAIFVKATFEEGKYPNKWIETNELLKYYMYSLKGNFNPSYKYNAAIINSVKTNTPIYVFEKQDTRLTLKGIFKYESDNFDPSDSSRWFILKKVNSLQTSKILTVREYDLEIEKQVRVSKKYTNAERKKRLHEADKIPAKLTVTSNQFIRNSDVIVEVLLRAKGVCEKCRKPAPFIRASDLSPYLEVHHIIPLAEGGEDTVENAKALCPNCHREVHHAADVITVTAGILIENGEVLITQCKSNDGDLGKWELPGGQIKNNEAPERCLRRELKEKLDITVRVQKFFCDSVYNNGKQIIRLMTYMIRRVEGNPVMVEHESLQWVKPDDIDNLELLPAVVPVIERLRNINR
ncbi:NUDIX domain-containing protein [Paenibacillus sp. CCS19]|uniref:NUDIX domain-containing protein n=1 Tax=Paenibacillus sp. CCS19 TaxID=3158387 RepID=UPI00295E5187|nr:NUDIX domain-containing protein [Paenibacillus cellulosilyticus]